MKGKKTGLLPWLVIFGLTACATIQTASIDCPLPNDINIVPPSPDLRKDIAAFSGKWVGSYENGRKIILVVEQIKDTEAWVIYSWGGGTASGSPLPPGYDRLKCKVNFDPKPQMVVPVKKQYGDYPLFLSMEDINTLIGYRYVLSPGWHHYLNIKLSRAN
jgi:hypothetical protein